MEAQNPQTGDIRLTTSVIGKIEPSDVVYIYPKAAGDVTAVNVKAGDVVTKGQVLCTIDTKQVESAKNTMDSAALALRQAQEELSRQQLLYAGGGLSEQQYSQYQNTVSSAQLSYDQAKYNYETQLEYSQITAPIEGLVEICNVENYDNVSQSNLIFVITGQGSRVVSFSATERIRGYLKEGGGLYVFKYKGWEKMETAGGESLTYRGAVCGSDGNRRRCDWNFGAGTGIPGIYDSLWGRIC